MDERRSMVIRNLFSEIPESTVNEIIEPLLKTDHCKLERIVSQGQKTPPGEWFDQEMNEWVILLSGNARLLFEGETDACTMLPGDYIYIPAHRRHRVEWTDPKQKTVWLALHFK
jgi:cupin 2 domain-containing protein